MHLTLVPTPWQGTCKNVIDEEFTWLQNLGDRSYCALYQNWTSTQQNLPIGYDLYVVSFYHEAINLEWVRQQSSLLDVPIIVLSDGNWYDQSIPNVHFYKYYYWHRQIEKLLEWYPLVVKTKKITKKFSSLCYRVGLNKALVSAILLDKISDQDIEISFGNWTSDDVVEYKYTGWPKIDHYVKYFRDNLQGTQRSLDLSPEKLLNSIHTYQQLLASDYDIPAYQNTALNFTNESFFCSLMESNGLKYIHPGPFITEKTLKCLISGTAFISTGQFETYQSLGNLGLEFNYDFDLSWDQDPGNLSRLTAILDLIDALSHYRAQDLYDMTIDSTIYNQQQVINGTFDHLCRVHNNASRTRLLEKFGC